MKLNKNLIGIFFIFVLLGLFIYFQLKTSNKNTNKISITASFYPMYFFASQIAGDKLDIINVTPPGAEPHDYVLTPSDIVKIQNSKLLVLNGNSESWADKISLKEVNMLVAGKDFEVNNDPHVWLSPRLAKLESEKIANSIEDIDPTNKEYYENNFKKLEMDLTKLDEKYKNGLNNCSLRTFVTSHKAFSYLARDYNLVQVAIEGLTPDEEPSLNKLAEIANFVKKSNIKYIFFESLVSPKLAQTLASEVGAQTRVLDPIEGVSERDLANGVNYLTLMESNLQNLKLAMECR